MYQTLQVINYIGNPNRPCEERSNLYLPPISAKDRFVPRDDERLPHEEGRLPRGDGNVPRDDGTFVATTIDYLIKFKIKRYFIMTAQTSYCLHNGSSSKFHIYLG